MRSISHTNSSLASRRRCPQLYNLRYEQRLARIDESGREALDVGNCWHAAHDAAAHGDDPYAVIAARAPGLLWQVKLSRLFAAYGSHWENDGLTIVESEKRFEVQPNGFLPIFQGRRDAKVRLADGRMGVLERKTTSDSLDIDSKYWKRLRLDTQVGLYALVDSFEGEQPAAFILYDVVRKPTISPKRLTKAEVERLRGELEKRGACSYYSEEFPGELVHDALVAGEEGPLLYGARLTSDIGDRPEHYFARREVPRTTQDYQGLLADLIAQVEIIEFSAERDLWPRNPDACHADGTCEFFSLCSVNRRPKVGEEPPEGFRRREHLHPELQ